MSTKVEIHLQLNIKADIQHKRFHSTLKTVHMCSLDLISHSAVFSMLTALRMKDFLKAFLVARRTV